MICCLGATPPPWNTAAAKCCRALLAAAGFNSGPPSKIAMSKSAVHYRQKCLAVYLIKNLNVTGSNIALRKFAVHF